MAAPEDELLIELLRQRDGLATEVLVADGNRYVVRNIAWGYDDGDEWAHVTTNISPSIDGATVDFFSTSAVEAVIDPLTGDVLYSRPGGST